MKFKFTLFLFIFLYGCSFDPDLFTDSNAINVKPFLSQEDEIRITLPEKENLIIEKEMIEKVKSENSLKKLFAGKNIDKIFFVKNRLINFLIS